MKNLGLALALVCMVYRQRSCSPPCSRSTARLHTSLFGASTALLAFLHPPSIPRHDMPTYLHIPRNPRIHIPPRSHAARLLQHHRPRLSPSRRYLRPAILDWIATSSIYHLYRTSYAHGATFNRVNQTIK